MTRWQPAAWLALSVVAGGLCGCGGGLRSGRLDPSGFVHQHYEYGIAPLADGSLLGSWQVQNFQPEGGRRFGVSKVGPDWIYRPLVDLDGNGTPEEAAEEPIFDLFLQNPSDAGEIWVRTLPLGSVRARTDLRVLARMYADAIAGAGLRAIRVSPDHVEVVERRFATRQIGARRGLIDGREAYEMTIEVANVDQLELDRTARWVRARILIIRTQLAWHPWAGTPRRLEPHLPVFMVVGYSNLPEDFDGGLSDFASLVSRIRFQTSLTLATPEAVLGCVRRPVVRFTVHYNAGGGVYEAVGLSPEERSCIGEHRLSVAGGFGRWRSFAYLAEPATIPEDDPPPVVDGAASASAPDASADVGGQDPPTVQPGVE